MAVLVDELAAWLEELQDDPDIEAVGIDEGGLTLIAIDLDGHPTRAYYEIGGIPDPDKEDE